MPATRLAAEMAANRSRAGSWSHRQVVEVGRVGDQPGRHQLEHPLLAQPFDVHGRAGREMGDALDALRRAVDVGAVGVALALEPYQRLPAGRARRREPPLGLRRFGTPGPPSTGPTTSGMTSPALRTMTRSPGRTSLTRTWSSLCSVATPDRRAADEDGLELPEGRRPAGAADRHHDVEQPRRPLLGRELEGHGPAGARDVAPSRACSARSSTLVTTPSIS